MKTTLNGLMELGKPCWNECRDTLQRLLSSSESVLRDSPLRKKYSVYNFGGLFFL